MKQIFRGDSRVHIPRGRGPSVPKCLGHIRTPTPFDTTATKSGMVGTTYHTRFRRRSVEFSVKWKLEIEMKLLGKMDYN